MERTADTHPRPNTPLLLTVRQAAAVLQLGTNRVYELARAGEIPAIRIGNTIRIPSRALEQWVERQHTDAQHELR